MPTINFHKIELAERVMSRYKFFILIPACFLILLCQAGFAKTVFIYPDSIFQTIDGFGGFGPKKVWWCSGLYFVRVSNGRESVIRKLGYLR
jgi:hypothetical protein